MERDRLLNVLTCTLTSLPPDDRTGDSGLVADRVLSAITPPPGTHAQLIHATLPDGSSRWVSALVPAGSADDPEWMIVTDPTLCDLLPWMPRVHAAPFADWLDALESLPGDGPVHVWLVDPEADRPGWMVPGRTPWRSSATGGLW